MRGIALATLLVVAAALPLRAQSSSTSANACEEGGDLRNRSSGPPHLWRIVAESGIRPEWEPDVCLLNPWYLVGDFDADGRYDYAVLMWKVAEPRSVRLAVLWHNGEVEWLDRDKELLYPDPEAWYVHPRQEVLSSGHFSDDEPPKLIGDGIKIYLLEEPEALIYWTGTRFVSWWPPSS